LNLDFPPPAFVGDVTTARIFILMANGGFDADLTPREFASPDAAEIYRQALRKPRRSTSQYTSLYYMRGAMGEWLSLGKAAVVNALAYRSPKISGEPENRKLADHLPSVVFHRRWLRTQLLPAAEAGKVLVIIKRPPLWGVFTGERAGSYVLYPTNPVSPYLSRTVEQHAREFLAGCA
jgi:hypothetical protein